MPSSSSSLLLSCLIAGASATAPAQPGKYMGLSQVMEGVDTPTAYTPLRGTYLGSLRLYGGAAGAGAHLRAGMGFFDRFFLGVSLTTNNLIGEGGIDADNPGVGARVRVLDEQGLRPSLALGWEGRGYGVKDASGHYPRAERGAYVAASRKVAPPLLLHGGISALKLDKVKGFEDLNLHLGSTLDLFKVLQVRGEWDDCADKGGGRFNLEGRLTVGGEASVAVDFVGIGGGTAASQGDANGQPRVSGRMLTLEYQGLF